MSLNTASMWAAIISGYLFVVVTLGGVLNWWFKNHIKSILDELKPNHGSSIKDHVNINTERLNRVERRVDDIYKLLCKINK